jgi:conjugal transfer pilus assembly protein TraF
MMRYFVLWVLLPSLASAQSLDYPSVWQCDVNKSHWYCDMDETIPAEQPPTQSTKRLELKEIRTAEQLRQELKRREDLAVMNPSEQNIKDYLALWQVTQDKGAAFADTWRRVVWQNPELDYTQKRPVNNSAIKVYDNARIQNEEQQLKLLAKEHGLIFFFRSDCRYCHAMAPTLKMITEKYGIEVLPISIDGKGLPDFPAFRDGRAKAAAWNIQRVPALFIGSKNKLERAPIGFGMMSLTEILNRIFVLTGTKSGENF